MDSAKSKIKRTPKSISSARLGVGGLLTLDLVKRAKRDARSNGKPTNVSHPVVLDRFLDNLNSRHVERLPLAGNYFNQFLRISGDGISLENQPMDTTDFRRRNLATIIEQRYGKKAAFADRYEMPRPNVTQLVNGPRPFGNELARRIEETEGLRAGWLDEEVPLTDEAMSVAREFMELNETNRAKLKEHLSVLTLIEKHHQDVVDITQSESKQS